MIETAPLGNFREARIRSEQSQKDKRDGQRPDEEERREKNGHYHRADPQIRNALNLFQKRDEQEVSQ
jgi:hypothetical protein